MLSTWWSRASLATMVLRKRARAARAEERYADAASLYEDLARLRPADARLRIQCGHMRKEAGDLARAEGHYLHAQRTLPNDADLALQLGHFYRIKGDVARSEEAYRRALDLNPGWHLPEAELRHLREIGWNSRPRPTADAKLSTPERDATAERTVSADDADAPALAGGLALLAPRLAPRRAEDLLREHAETIDVRRLGRKEPSSWGILPTLRGVEALRGFCISHTPIADMRILLDGMTIHRTTLKGGYDLEHEVQKERIKKYVFNAWYDFGNFAPGRYKIELRFTDAEDETRSFNDIVVIAEPLSLADVPTSDGIVPMSDPDPVSLERRIRAAPSVVRPARRALFPNGVHTVLVLRTDQLGDMIASIPAMLRLREIVPGAKIVGLLTAANVELARTLDLFDEIVTIDFPDDRIERRRIMPLADQKALRDRLIGYDFDIAIDLAHSDVSRDLLRLSNAKFTYGIGGGDWPWMTAEATFHTRDRWSAMDITPHSTKVLATVEALGTILRDNAPVIRRAGLSRDLLAPFALDGQRYVLLHAGARIAFSRWPKYPELARLLLERTDLHVVMISEDAGARETLPDDLLRQDRFRFVDQRLTFDTFDALISFATVVVGNDSGPKHLAALRGTNVVTLFTARINWTEWGQENIGSIISRRVPCQGCAILHDAEDCGQDFTCIADIQPQEVFDAVMRYV